MAVGATVLPQKDPSDVVEYTVTLDGIEDDPIVSVSYVAAGLTLPGGHPASFTADTFTFWVSAGTDGTEGTVRATITTTAGRVFGRTFAIPVRAM